jgi:undecaprenyl-phosphate 4-deoxy-4-formamido-L-arabinose transferase
MKLSVCVPVYYGEATIGRLVEEVTARLARDGQELEIVLVNDGSKDGSEQALDALAEKYSHVTAITLRRNFGEHNAVMCALAHATGDYAVIIDDDFQNPPSEIQKLVDEARKGYDVVYSRYEKKQHHPLRNLGSWFNDVMATALLRKPRHLYLSSFKVIARPVIDEILKYKGPFPYIDGLVLRATDNVTSVLVAHHPREEGRSSYTLGKLVDLWLSMFVNFSIRPMRVITLLGIFTALASLGLGVYFLAQELINPASPQGWASLVTLMLFLGGIQTFSLGIIGEYIGKNYLDRNGTPQWTIKTKRLARS